MIIESQNMWKEKFDEEVNEERDQLFLSSQDKRAKKMFDNKNEEGNLKIS